MWFSDKAIRVLILIATSSEQSRAKKKKLIIQMSCINIEIDSYHTSLGQMNDARYLYASTSGRTKKKHEIKRQKCDEWKYSLGKGNFRYRIWEWMVNGLVRRSWKIISAAHQWELCIRTRLLTPSADTGGIGRHKKMCSSWFSLRSDLSCHIPSFIIYLIEHVDRKFTVWNTLTSTCRFLAVKDDRVVEEGGTLIPIFFFFAKYFQ